MGMSTPSTTATKAMIKSLSNPLPYTLSKADPSIDYEDTDSSSEDAEQMAERIVEYERSISMEVEAEKSEICSRSYTDFDMPGLQTIPENGHPAGDRASERNHASKFVEEISTEFEPELESSTVIDPREPVQVSSKQKRKHKKSITQYFCCGICGDVTQDVVGSVRRGASIVKNSAKDTATSAGDVIHDLVTSDNAMVLLML